MTTKAAILKSIRTQCIGCMGNQPFLVEGCTSPECSLYPFRFGNDPKPSKKGFAERRKIGPGDASTREKIRSFSTNRTG
jgi:hypothetical protein